MAGLNRKRTQRRNVRIRVSNAVARLPGGKFSVRSGTSQIETVILADQVHELRIRQGQVHVLRPSKVLDPEDQFPNWELGSEVVDDI